MADTALFTLLNDDGNLVTMELPVLDMRAERNANRWARLETELAEEILPWPNAVAKPRVRVTSVSLPTLSPHGLPLATMTSMNEERHHCCGSDCGCGCGW